MTDTTVVGVAGQRVARQAVGIAVLTVSDSRTLETDTSGACLSGRATQAGHRVVERALVRDDQATIEATLDGWVANPAVDVIITTGGTGITGRDVTVEAVTSRITRMIPGFGELCRMLSYQEIGASTIQSRALGGLSGETLVFALPGSTGACRLGWDSIIGPQLDIDQRPCNLVGLMPRLSER